MIFPENTEKLDFWEENSGWEKQIWICTINKKWL